jgi:hypothetical protein
MTPEVFPSPTPFGFHRWFSALAPLYTAYLEWLGDKQYSEFKAVGYNSLEIMSCQWFATQSCAAVVLVIHERRTTRFPRYFHYMFLDRCRIICIPV